jgi:glycosyltransferase involved in cell wall biosynthesis
LKDNTIDLPVDSERLLAGSPAMAGGLRMPLVSVIVTAYNCERYVLKTLESVAEQNYGKLECFIVEDCSTDGTLPVIEEFLAERRDPRFKLLRHEQNQGQMSAQITGFRVCNGEFVVFLDSDDLLFPDSLEAHLSVHLGCEPVAALTCFDAAMIDGNDVLLSAHHREIRPDRWEFFRPHATRKSIQVLGKEVDCRIIPPAPANRVVLRDQYFWTTQSFMMFRRDFLDVVMPEKTEYFRICADYYILCMAHAFNTTILVNSCGGAYRVHGSNGFTQSRLVSADQESGDPRRFRWQPQHGAALAATIMEERFELFGITFGDFRVARALLSLPGRIRPSVFRLLQKRMPSAHAAFCLAVAVVSARIARLRIAFGTCRRIFWNGY